MADIESDFLPKLRSTDAKQRLDALSILVPDDAPICQSHLHLVAGVLPSLLAEINPLALKKLYIALEELLRQDTLDPNQFQSIATVLVEKGLSNTKPALKDQAKDILVALSARASLHSAPGQPNVVIQSLLAGLSAKSPKVLSESALCLQAIVEKYGIFGMDVPPFIRLVAPVFQNKDLKVRRSAMKIAALLAMKIGVEPIKGMLGPNTPKQYITAFEGVMEEVIQDLQKQQEGSADSSSVQDGKVAANLEGKRAISPPVIVQHFTYDPFDDCPPTSFHLPKNWDKMITDKNWKERKQILDDQIKVLSSLTRIDRTQLSLPQIFKQLKTIIDSDLSVAVVSATMRFAASLAVLIGPMGPYSSTSKLLVVACTNRLKERKAPVIAGYNLFMHSLLVHSHRLSDISADMWAVAIPHKNSEVKEDSCRFLRTIWASAIVYNTVYYLGKTKLSVQLPNQILQSAIGQAPSGQTLGSNSVDYTRYKDLEDVVINYLLNDGFPGAQKALPEGTPVSGELSPGIQLKSRVHRERVSFNSILIDITPSQQNLQDPGDFSGLNLVFDSLDKLLGDSSAVIRAPALKAYAFGIVAHISEILAFFTKVADGISQAAFNLLANLKARFGAKDARKQTELMDLIKKVCISVGRNDILDILEGRTVPVVGQQKSSLDAADHDALHSHPHLDSASTVSATAPQSHGRLFMPPSHQQPPQGAHTVNSGVSGPGHNFVHSQLTGVEQANSSKNKVSTQRAIKPGIAPREPRDQKDQELTISTNPNFYDQRKMSTIKWIIDPFNADAPVSLPARDELYNQLCQIIPPNYVSDMFLKKVSSNAPALLSGQQGIPRGIDAKFTGTSKTIVDTVSLLRNAMLGNHQGVVAQRDVLMKYISLLFCDGFAAPATPNTTQVKAACQITEDLINILIDNEVVLTISDLDYLFPAILARLEQFNMTQLKVQITSLAERHVHLTSFENIINVALMHLLGRNARIQIRQMPTKFAIIRLVSVMAEASRDNDHCLELSLAPIQSLLSIYKTSVNTDTYTFSEGHISENYPKLRGGSARTIFITCLATIINACDALVRTKLMPLIEKTLHDKDLQDFRSLILPCMTNQVEEPQNYITQTAPENPSIPLIDPLNGFSPAEHYANTSMRGQLGAQVFQSQKSMQSMTQASLQGPSLLTGPSLCQNTSIQSNNTSFSQQLSPQIAPTDQLGHPLPLHEPSQLQKNYVNSYLKTATTNASIADAPSPVTLTSTSPTHVLTNKVTSPTSKLADSFPPLMDFGNITLISPEANYTDRHYSIDSTRTPTTTRQFQPRSLAETHPFDDVLSEEALHQLENQGHFHTTELENHVLALKRAVYLANTNQINVATMLPRFINAASNICHFFFLCEKSSEKHERQLRLLVIYAQFLHALCGPRGTILCAPRSCILLAITDMLVFMILFSDSQLQSASCCYSALIDLMQSANITDVIICLIMLFMKVNACVKDSGKSLLQELHLLQSVHLARSEVREMFSSNGPALAVFSNVLLKLWAKIRTPFMQLISLAHGCRLDVATHIFKCSDLVNQESLYKTSKTLTTPAIHWKRVAEEYPEFITTVGTNTCIMTTTVPDVLDQKGIQSTVLVLDDILLALNTFCLTDAGTSYSALFQNMISFVEELCSILGSEIYLYIRKAIHDPLRTLIDKYVASSGS
ncbi:Spindle pole body protein, putative [Giardia lamblia P15]|uniref:Spindle pole body protein, putative n=1 Tax=Giardia intestinalis (strain P15) TaxID=658858 RepID=E1EYF8_GIAIA|nr:Spindle pole body protein, putative [Giardia lamblia P15]